MRHVPQIGDAAAPDSGLTLEVVTYLDYPPTPAELAAIWEPNLVVRRLNDMQRVLRILPIVAAAALVGPFLIAAATSSGVVAAPDAAVGLVNRLGGNLQVALAAEPDDPAANLVFSPTSIGVTLAMASAGAASDTVAQMNEMLGIANPAAPGPIHQAMASLIQTVTGPADEHTMLSLANSLWTQDGLDVAEPFRAILADQYGSELQLADFANDPAGAVVAVNAWVAEATADRIPQLLDDQDVTALTRFILVNAIHLDADWRSPFAPEATREDQFTRPDGSGVTSEFMFQNLDAEYAEGDGLQAVVLPYTQQFEMVVILPDAGLLGDLERALSTAGGDLDAVVGPFGTANVDVSLPKWDTDVSTNLLDVLRGMGLTLPFDPALADFSNITTDEPLSIGGVIHQANITVDEAGTEAAAATAIVGPTGAAPGQDVPEPIEMDVDHPFFFAIRDTVTGAVLFQGHINDPTG